MSVEEHLANFVGAECWSVIGDQTPDAHLGFGGKQRRARLLDNATLTPDERAFAPTLDLLVKCSWQLVANEQLTLTDSEFGGEALKVLIGQKVRSIECHPTNWTLSLYFSGGMQLRADVSTPKDVYDCYSVGVNGRYWSVHPGGVTSWD